MEWYVYSFDMNRQKIKKFNVFDHWRFKEDLMKAKKKYKKKDEFAEKLKGELKYHFWSKCEYELIISIKDNGVYLSPWCGCKEPEKVRIDVTDEEFDWRGFAEKHIARQIFKNEAKIDVYEQLMYVWDEFVDYVWEHRKSKK